MCQKTWMLVSPRRRKRVHDYVRVWWCNQNYINERCNKKKTEFSKVWKLVLRSSLLHVCRNEWSYLWLWFSLFTGAVVIGNVSGLFPNVDESKEEERECKCLFFPTKLAWERRIPVLVLFFSFFYDEPYRQNFLAKLKKVASGLFTILVKESEKSKSRPKNRKWLFKKMEKKSILKVL